MTEMDLETARKLLAEEEERLDREEAARVAEEQRQAELRRIRQESEKAEYLASPALRRLKLWRRATGGWNLSEAFDTLGRALEEWAEEEEARRASKPD